MCRKSTQTSFNLIKITTYNNTKQVNQLTPKNQPQYKIKLKIELIIEENQPCCLVLLQHELSNSLS